MSRPIITFLSDYGLDDEFVGVCKGMMLRVLPDAQILDVTHGVDPGNVRAGALALLRAVQYLPEGVHLAIVDPGVGTERVAVAVVCGARTFVGPDNGLLSPAVAMVGGATAAVRIDPSRLGRGVPPSTTFHGRDVFAPAAAALAAGASLDDLGDRIDPSELLPMMLPLCQVREGQAEGVVWWVDRFGNAETNVTPEDLQRLGIAPGDELAVRIGSTVHEMPFVSTFGDAEPGAPLAFVDAVGLVAMAVNGGRAASVLGAAEGVSVAIGQAEGRESPPSRAG